MEGYSPLERVAAKAYSQKVRGTRRFDTAARDSYTMEVAGIWAGDWQGGVPGSGKGQEYYQGDLDIQGTWSDVNFALTSCAG